MLVVYLPKYSISNIYEECTMNASEWCMFPHLCHELGDNSRKYMEEMGKLELDVGGTKRIINDMPPKGTINEYRAHDHEGIATENPRNQGFREDANGHASDGTALDQ